MKFDDFSKKSCLLSSDKSQVQKSVDVIVGFFFALKRAEIQKQPIRAVPEKRCSSQVFFKKFA